MFLQKHAPGGSGMSRETGCFFADQVSGGRPACYSITCCYPGSTIVEAEAAAAIGRCA